MEREAVTSGLSSCGRMSELTPVRPGSPTDAPPEAPSNVRERAGWYMLEFGLGAFATSVILSFLPPLRRCCGAIHLVPSADACARPVG